MRHTWWLRPTTTTVAILLLALTLIPVAVLADIDGPTSPTATQASPPVESPASEQTSSESSADPSDMGRPQTLKGKKRRGGANRRKSRVPRSPPEPLPEPGTLAYAWHCLIWAYTYPFYYLHEHYGPFAANAFGIFLIMLVTVVPSAFRPKKERELKLKERLIRAKNTRIRVRAAQTVEQYVAAVDLLTRDIDEISLPLRGLRKMFKMPAAQSVTYSKAIKGLRKESIHVNENVYPVGQRSLDRAMQDLKSCLARELEVSEEEAGEMASTVVHRSNQPRTMEDPALALHALVADSNLTEIRQHESSATPLHISCVDGKVEVRRSTGYVVLIAGTDDPLLYLKLNFSINFRSTTDEGTLKLHRYRPGEKRRELPSGAAKKKDSAGLSQRGFDLWIDSKLFGLQRIGQRLSRMLPWASSDSSLEWGAAAERVKILSSAVQESGSSDDLRDIIAEFLKHNAFVDINNASRALGIEPSKPLSEQGAEDKLSRASVSIDGVQVADVGAGIVHRVKVKLQRRIKENCEGASDEQVDQLVNSVVRDGARLCTAVDVHKILLAMFRNQRLHVDVAHDRAFSQPLEITTEGGELVSEQKMLFSVVQLGESGERSVVLQWLEARHRNWTTQNNEVGSRGSFSTIALKSHPAPRASKLQALPPVPKAQKNDNRVLVKVRQRLKQLKELERRKLGKDSNHSSSSSPTSSKYPSTVGSGRSSTGSSPRLSLDTGSSPRLDSPVVGSPTLSHISSAKPRSAALARAFLKKANQRVSPTVSPAPSGPDTPSSSVGTPTPPGIGSCGSKASEVSPSDKSVNSMSEDTASVVTTSTNATARNCDVDAALLFDSYDSEQSGVLLRWQLESLASLMWRAGIDADAFTRNWDVDRKVTRSEFVARMREIMTDDLGSRLSCVSAELERHVAVSRQAAVGGIDWDTEGLLRSSASEVFEAYDWDGDGTVDSRVVCAVLEAVAAKRLNDVMPKQVLRAQFVDRVEELTCQLGGKHSTKRKALRRLESVLSACRVTCDVSVEVSRKMRSEGLEPLLESRLRSASVQPASGSEAQEAPSTPTEAVPLSPAANSGLDALDRGFEEYFQKLVQNSPQLLDSEPDDPIGDTQQPVNRSNPEIVSAAREYLIKSRSAASPPVQRGNNADSESVSPDWLEAAKMCSKNAEDARLAATEALDRLINVDGSPLP